MLTAGPMYQPSFGYVAPRPAPPRSPLPQAFLTGSDPNFNNQWWYPDSGASHHVTPDTSNLSNSISLPGFEQVFIGNGQGLSINSVGSMQFLLPNYSHISLTLHNLLLVPHITKNLISVSKFAQDNHFFFEFHPQFCLVKSQASSEILLRGVVGADGLYKFLNPSSQLFKSFPSLNTCVSSSSEACNLSNPCNHFLHSNTKCTCISLCTNDSYMNEIGSACHNIPNVNIATQNISKSSQHVNTPTSIFYNKYVLWHTRLGHPHHHALAEVLKHCHTPIPSKPPA